MCFLCKGELDNVNCCTRWITKLLDDQTRLGAVSTNVDLEAETDRRTRAPVPQSSLHSCARILARGLVRPARVPGLNPDLLLLIGGGHHVGPRAVAHGGQLSGGGACTLPIPHRIVHELVTKTLVWFSSGRACGIKMYKISHLHSLSHSPKELCWFYDSWTRYSKIICLTALRYSNNLITQTLVWFSLGQSPKNMECRTSQLCFLS